MTNVSSSFLRSQKARQECIYNQIVLIASLRSNSVEHLLATAELYKIQDSLDRDRREFLSRKNNKENLAIQARPCGRNHSLVQERPATLP